MNKDKFILLAIVTIVSMFLFGYFFHPIILFVIGNVFFSLVSTIAIIAVIIALIKHFKLKSIISQNADVYKTNDELWREIADLKRKQIRSKK